MRIQINVEGGPGHWTARIGNGNVTGVGSTVQTAVQRLFAVQSDKFLVNMDDESPDGD